MSYQTERARFIFDMAQHNMPYPTALLMLRYAVTLQRLSEAQCNGDWPYDNGERTTVPCPLCESGTVPSQILGSVSLGRVKIACDRCKGTAFETAENAVQRHCRQCSGTGRSIPRACPDCRTTARVKASLPAGWTAHFAGDPRGYVLRLVVPGGQYSDSGRGDHGVFGVPS